MIGCIDFDKINTPNKGAVLVLLYDVFDMNLSMHLDGVRLIIHIIICIIVQYLMRVNMGIYCQDVGINLICICG